jgi:hypothetical protein
VLAIRADEFVGVHFFNPLVMSSSSAFLRSHQR